MGVDDTGELDLARFGLLFEDWSDSRKQLVTAPPGVSTTFKSYSSGFAGSIRAVSLVFSSVTK